MKSLKYIIMVLVFIIIFAGCKNNEIEPIKECEHINATWEWEENAKCGRSNIKYLYCDDCGEIIDEAYEFKEHDLNIEVFEPTCTERGYTLKTCKNCSYELITDYVIANGHNIDYVIDQEATDTYGIKHKECKDCDHEEEPFEYVNNGFSSHGALHVSGIDLLDENDEKFRLVGVSTFGLQWQPQYVNYETFANLKDTFGVNLIRLAMYTAEGGYCNGGEQKKKQMYDTVVKGINIATELDMYVIVDWHMLGVDEGDNNPLFYLEESKEFFDKITKEFSDHDNILFEIMNEPCYVEWKDCKKYALEIMPVIRNNMPNAIILVGNPQWSSDLASVAKDPVTGFDNFMYTFHFYANDNTMTSKISTACGKNNLPVFITEHGGMDASGYGDINYSSLSQWYKILDKYNISFVAWSLSNLDSSSCMFKTGSPNLSDFSDDNLKEWGIYYKGRVREVMGLPISKNE